MFPQAAQNQNGDNNENSYACVRNQTGSHQNVSAGQGAEEPTGAVSDGRVRNGAAP